MEHKLDNKTVCKEVCLGWFKGLISSTHIQFSNVADYENFNYKKQSTFGKLQAVEQIYLKPFKTPWEQDKDIKNFL